MGFYLRKTIKVGGVNLNLSGSGLGISTGVKGFRVGMNGRGTYVQMGRGGLYYRKQVSWNRGARASARRSAPSVEAARFLDQGIIYSENLAQPLEMGLADADNEKLLAHFRPAQKRTWLWLSLAGGAVSAVWSVPVAFAIVAAASILAVATSMLRQTAPLIYDLDGPALERYEKFVNNFGEFFRADRLWLYEQRAVTTDWKRNAGATNLMSRRAAAAMPSGDPTINTNLSIPCLKSGLDAFYFLPDLIVCREGPNLRCFKYEEFGFAALPESFIEEQAVPSDAQVVGQTWKFVRKDGGPDRRFNNNRQIPICRYQALRLRLGDAFQRTFSKSRIADDRAFTDSLKRMAEVWATLRVVEDLKTLPSPKQPASPV